MRGHERGLMPFITRIGKLVFCSSCNALDEILMHPRGYNPRVRRLFIWQELSIEERDLERAKGSQ